VEKNVKFLEADNTLPVVDEVVIQRLKELESPEDEIPFSKQMINGFLSSLPSMLDSFKKAFSEKSEKDVKYFAHKFAGFSMNVGGRRFASFCQQIELSPQDALANGEAISVAEQLLIELQKELSKR
jgi:HPt (histidine-containing phosphotransfer) domain-containing protein